MHLAFQHNFSDFDAAIAADAAAITAIGDALAGSDRPFVTAGVTPAVPGRAATEDDLSAFGPTAAREANATLALSLAERDIRTSVVRLPRSVHGLGDKGFVPQMAAVSQRQGVSGFIDDGAQRWPAVHVRDAASLFRLALEEGVAGRRYHAVDDEGVTLREMAEAIGRQYGLPVAAVGPEPYGFPGVLMGVDQPASSVQTRAELGWEPTYPSLLEDIETDGYFRSH
ncbi:3-beta hydroxysteroid dehydrogenase [Lysinibacter sp. HNR]|uniref:3-beta hydroxysteroid dehydrogenase n=1 Tax=Lysinibacter sp. HNR TaxID=3031408 RepID=UPI002434DE54|nr:3-beta hydroxysteroid dehydrogenase [Lysinibacter sp. HNR]WGD36873.1 3-beta hydroxysteroid dehydrogenase [Lysinibacter sp. HNR]